LHAAHEEVFLMGEEHVAVRDFAGLDAVRTGVAEAAGAGDLLLVA
jgi:hypothetical protein